MSLLITPADKYFSLCIRERADWICERCGRYYGDKRQGLHCSHFVSRGHWGTRFHPKNAAAHCFGCHRHLSSSPHEFVVWIVQHIGRETYEELQRTAAKPAKGLRKHVKTIAKHYRDENTIQLQCRTNGYVGRVEFNPSPIIPQIELTEWRKALGDA